MKKWNVIIFFLVFIFVISLDQGVKIWVVNNMDLHEAKTIPYLSSIMRLKYILNPGLINGFLLWGKYTKILLLILRIVIILLLFNFTIKNAKKKNVIDIIKPSLIISGGIGNTIDWIFYGIFFNNAPNDAPFNFCYGQVVDMLQFKIPDFIPFLGGNYSKMIFNIADISILIGIGLYIFLKNKSKNKE